MSATNKKADKEIVIGLVEDNKDDAKFFEKLLKDCHSFKIVRFDYFRSGEACLEKMAYSNDVDVILMDYNLGKGMMSGVDCIKRLKANERTKHIQIIVLTHEDYTPEQIIEALSAGATAFLRKQYDKFVLESAIRDALDGCWKTYASAITDLIEHLKEKYRNRSNALPNAPQLSAFEIEVVKKIAEGKSNETLIAELKPSYDKFFDNQGNSYKTLSLENLRRIVLPQIYAKFGIDTDEESQSRARLVARAFRHGVIQPKDLEV